MPHIVIEYSNTLADLDFKGLIHACHHAMNGLHNVTTDRVKTRAIKLDDFEVGIHGTTGQMVHVTLKLMTGRSIEARQELAKILHDVVREFMPQEKYPNAALTVEIVELDRATYIA